MGAIHLADLFQGVGAPAIHERHLRTSDSLISSTLHSQKISKRCQATFQPEWMR